MNKAIIAISLFTVLTGCSAEKRLSGVPNTFLEDVDTSAKRENLPFEHAWLKPGLEKSKYTKVYVKPIRLDKLPQGAWKNSISTAIVSKEDYDETAEKLTAYFHDQIESKLREQPQQRLTVVSNPGPNTVVVEIALTELEFSHPVARAGALASPIPGTGAAVSAVSDPHVSFAARLTDGASGELIATAADRKFPPMRIVDLNKLTASSSAREVCSIWAGTIAAGLQGGDAKEADENYALLPW